MEFYCTAGRGTEMFVSQELFVIFQEHLHKVCVTDGKVFFTVKGTCTDVGNRVHKLATVERLFVHVLLQEKANIKGKRELLTLLHTGLNQRTLWENAEKVLNKVKLTHVTKQSEPASSEIFNTNCGDSLVTKKVKLDSDRQNNAGTFPSESNSEIEQECFERQINKTTRNMETFPKDIQYRSIALSSVEDKVDISKKTKTEDLMENQPLSDLTFRVSCKFSGSVRHKLNIQRTVKQMGVLISKTTGWRIDLQNPKLEISIHMNDEKMMVGIPISKEPLSKRSYIKHHGLRATVCRIIADLANIQPGDIVLDPMCGKATILVEAAHVYQTSFYLGMDINEGQIKMSTDNVNYGQLQGTVHIVQGNTLNIPLPDSCVDKVITDAPFGQNHQVETDLYQFYLNMLCEVSRVLKSNGLIVLLTSGVIKNLLIHLTMNKSTQINGESKKGIKTEHTQTDNVHNSDHDMVCENKQLWDEGRGKSEEKCCVDNSKESHLVHVCRNPHEFCERKDIVKLCHDSNVTMKTISDNSVTDISKYTRSDLERFNDIRTKGQLVTNCDSNCIGLLAQGINNEEADIDSSSVHGFHIPNSYDETEVFKCLTTDSQKLKSLFVMKQCHYMKLGATDGFVCVLQNIKKKIR